jgi:hypothetical protein
MKTDIKDTEKIGLVKNQKTRIIPMKEYMFTFEGGGWNTVWAKTRRGAIKAALKKYEDSDTLNVITNSVVRSTPETMEHVLSLFY